MPSATTAEAIAVLGAFHLVQLGTQIADEVRRRVQQHTLGHRAPAWPPAYTNGSPGYRDVPGGGIGTVGVPGGLSQITWNGHPLYLFTSEALAPTPNGGAAPVGNGNGIKACGSTFSLVVNP
jgi:hypothetical protein